MTPRAVVSSVDEPPGRSDLGGRRTPQLQVRTTAVPAEAGRGRRSESPQLKPTILTLPRPWASHGQFSGDPQEVYDRWTEFLAWYEENRSALTPAGSGQSRDPSSWPGRMSP